MLNIAVCDDEIVAIEMISKAVKSGFERLGCSTNIYCYNYGKELRKKVFSGAKFDVLFLDIDMEDINGIELAKHLRDNRSKSLIVFISNREEYVFKSFEASPFRFIRKIEFQNEIGEVLKDIVMEIKHEVKSHIVLETTGASIKINPYETVYIECNNKILYIKGENKTLELKYKLSDIEQMLDGYGFIRVHKGYLVNFRFIYSIEKTDIILDNGEHVPVSKYRLADVKDEYRRLTI